MSSGQPLVRATRGRRDNVTEEEIEALREEQHAAREHNVDWRDRGPNDAPFWRGQAYRQGHYGGSKGYRNRGGKWRDYYAKLNAEGRLQPGKGGAKVVPPNKATAEVAAIVKENRARKGQGKGSTS